jgi:uncharacterized MAPEG superfamily protein
VNMAAVHIVVLVVIALLVVCSRINRYESEKRINRRGRDS